MLIAVENKKVMWSYQLSEHVVIVGVVSITD